MSDLLTSSTLPREFYSRNSPEVAKALLGKLLVRKVNGIKLIGRIVETEAYLGLEDEAAHSFIGETTRNRILFGEAGYTYVHSIHRYHCIDIVAGQPNLPVSVLIRAVEPIESIELMKQNRNTTDEKNLTNGPGKLCQAFGITRIMNGIDVTDDSSEIVIYESDLNVTDDAIITSSRIGISKAKDLPLRFYIGSSSYVSKSQTKPVV
jgi:DNA-3-methyladenine glycosylase